MKRITKWGALGIAVGGVLGSIAVYAVTPWDLRTWSGGRCSIIGCSGCGANGCSRKERFCSYTCQGDPKATNTCMHDDGC
jgi:hypothetical protein